MSSHAFRFTLFVTGITPRTENALANLRRICEDRLDGFELEVVDVLEQPEVAEQWKVLATPTLIREAPPPRRRVTGDLSDTAKVLHFLMLPASPLRQTGDSGP